MPKKATAVAPANIAFVKYMGRKDDVLRLPDNGSISMNLSNILTTTTVEFSPLLSKDSISIDGESREKDVERVINHLDRIRALASVSDRARVVSLNNFSVGTGLSSSSSGFAALTVAGVAAAGLKLSEKELSILARQASGSACRSIPDGFVEWLDGDTSETSYALSLYEPAHWDIVDAVVMVSSERKEIGSSVAHERVRMGPYYAARIDRMPAKILRCKELLASRDFSAFGAFLEEEALDLHALFMSAGIVYLTPESLRLIRLIPDIRKRGIEAYFTLNTGQDVHIFCQGKDAAELKIVLENLGWIRKVVLNNPARGASLIDEHLF